MQPETIKNIPNIWAVARNYALHAQELGNNVPSSPIVFLKAGSCAVHGSMIELPTWITEVHHEIEMALQFDDCLNISYLCLALDLTERTEQSRAKQGGLPWTLAKSFKQSCPLSPFVKAPALDELQDISIQLIIDGKERQSGNTSFMIFKIPQLVEFIKMHFPVCPGDLLLTGTPAGVGAVHRGNSLVGRLGNFIEFEWNIR